MGLMAAGVVIAYSARYAAGALLVLAAAGKALAGAQPDRTRSVAAVLLIMSESTIGVALLAPIGGLPVAPGAACFAGFALVQVLGRMRLPAERCGCYGRAAPDARYGYLAAVVFVLLSGAVLWTTTQEAQPVDTVSGAGLRVAGVVAALCWAAFVGRQSADESGIQTT